MRRPGVAWLIALIGGAGATAHAGPKGPVIISDQRASGTSAAKQRALVVGVAGFADARWPALRFTTKDATDMARALERGGFDVRELRETAGPTGRAFLDAVASLGQDSKPEDVLLVYVSTHGTIAKSPSGALEQVLVLSDTDHAHPFESGVVLRDLLARFDALPPERKVLILATCYSGAGKSSFSEAVAGYLGGLKGALAPPLYEVSKATIVLSAASFGEPAREDERLEHDIYTHFFLEALRGYDPNHDGATSVTEAHDFARAQTYRYSGGAQRPTALMRLVGEDPITLSGARTQSGDPMLTSFSAGLEGYRVTVDGVEKGVLPGGIAIEPGWREVAILSPHSQPEGGEVVRRRIHVSEGEWIDLGTLRDRELPLQLELHAGAWLRPGSERGSSLVFLGNLGVLARAQELVWGLDLSAKLGTGFGFDVITVNQQGFDATLWETRAALGLGTHLDLGGVLWHLDAWGGAGHLRRTVSSPFFAGPQTEWLGSAGLSTALRWRIGEIFSLGGGLGGEVLFSEVVAPGATAWVQGALSL